MSIWQPITTAPKDGTEILTIGPDCDYRAIATKWLDPGPYVRTSFRNYYRETGWYWASWSGEPVGPVNPTLWQPLPDLPKCKGTIDHADAGWTD